MPNRSHLTLGFVSLFAFAALGIIAQAEHFPYNFSNQDKIDPEKVTGGYVASETAAVFDGENVAAPGPDLALADNNSNKKVLGDETSNDEKRIEVDLTNQRLYAFEGDNEVMDFLISSGKWGKTPTGEFRIWTKLRYTRMTGGNKALHTYYNLPNVPFTMFFANSEVPMSKGFGIHGTYWHSNFGHPMSHGCINMKTEEVEQLYYWANPVLGDKTSIRATADNPGTKVVIYGTAPNK